MFRQFRITRSRRQISQTIQCDFFGVGRPADSCQILFRHFESIPQVLADHLVVSRNDALDGRTYPLSLQRPCFQTLQRTRQIDRGDYHHQGIGRIDHLIDVAADMQAFHRKFHRRQIQGIDSLRLQAFQNFRLSNPPMQLFLIVQQNLGNRRSPATATYNRNILTHSGQKYEIPRNRNQSPERAPSNNPYPTPNFPAKL